MSDHGTGVDPALGDRVFEPFQGGSSGSTGIGLAICKAIVEAHGGTIAVGDTPGGGADSASPLQSRRDGPTAQRGVPTRRPSSSWRTTRRSAGS